MNLAKALEKFTPAKPADYSHLTPGTWLWREIQILGCRTNLFHIDREGKAHLFDQPWDGRVDCFCSFWDAQ